MDLLRLPSSIRCSLLSTPLLRRYLTTSLYVPSTPDAPEPLIAAPPLPPRSPALLALSPSTLNSYQIAVPPTIPQLKYSNTFFVTQAPYLLYSAAYFRSLPLSPHPEVAFFGRSNVGKSSLLNALFNRTSLKDARVSKRPGRTKTMNGFGVAGPNPYGAEPKQGGLKEEAWKRFPRGGCVVLDMPGYGGGSQEVWGREALKYLEGRKQLRRVFLLVDAEHGLKSSDVQLLTHLKKCGVSHQIVLSKVDKVLYPAARPPGPTQLSNRLYKLKDVCEGVRKQVNAETGDGKRRDAGMDILCCSAEKGVEEHNRHRKAGVDEVRWAVLSACGLECDESGEKRKNLRLQDIKVLREDDEDD